MEGLGQIVAGWCYERSASVIQMCSRCGRPKTKAEATFFGAQQPLLDTPVLLYPTISIPSHFPHLFRLSAVISIGTVWATCCVPSW